MSLQLYSQIPGTQVKRDANLSNATIQCDPKLLFPLGASQAGVPLNKENLAGKIAVEHDICNLDVNNLTVNGVLKAKGPAEICDIDCPEDFTVTAGGNMDLSTTGAASTLSINTESTVANAIHLHIPDTGTQSTTAHQISIQNQNNIDDESLLVRSDRGGVRIDAGSALGAGAGNNCTVVLAAGSITGLDCGPQGTRIAPTGGLAFFNSGAPVAQPTNGITAAPFVANSSGIANDTATYGGYTVGQIVAALQALGLLQP